MANKLYTIPFKYNKDTHKPVNISSGTNDKSFMKDHDSLRLYLRQLLLPVIQRETDSLVQLQNLTAGYTIVDSFMRLAGIVGTHSFYLVMLPILRWIAFGSTVESLAPHKVVNWSFQTHSDRSTAALGIADRPTTVVMDVLYLFGRDLIVLLGFGCYFSGFLKDYLCLPRPPSPPVRRLSKVEEGAHLEFGFPSTHSTNCFITALWAIYFIHVVMRYNSLPWIALSAFSLIYASIVSYSRLHCGLHSRVDVVGGILIAVAIVGTWIYLRDVVQIWSLYIPHVELSALGMVMLFIAVHPHPMDACPCFDDSVAFLGVIAGVVAGNQFSMEHAPVVDGIIQYAAHNNAPFSYFNTALRLSIGVSTLLLWRITVKATLKYIFSLLALPSLASPRAHVPLQKKARRDLRVKKKDSFAIINEPLDAKSFSEEQTAINNALKNELESSNPVYKLDKFGTVTLTKIVVYFGIGQLTVNIIPTLFTALQI